jgi:tol-pal system protein YbgF
MNTIRPSLLVCLFAACVGAAPVAARAQSREQQQIFADLRILQEQVQQLKAAVNALAEQAKATNARIDAQGEATRKNYADQLQLVRELQSSVETMGQKVQSNSAQVTKLAQELPPLRDGLNMLQQLIAQVAAQLQPMAAADPNAAPAAAGGTTPPSGGPPPTGSGVPPSPGTYWNAAMGYYAVGQWDLAVEAFRDFAQKFPTSPDAAEAQFFIGESYYQSGKTRDALTAYTAVTTNYKDAPRVPDAYFKQAMCYELLNQKTEAIRVYQLIVKQYEGTSAALSATQSLKRLGVIKDE